MPVLNGLIGDDQYHDTAQLGNYAYNSAYSV